MQRCQQVTDLRGAARCPSLCITRQNTTGPEFWPLCIWTLHLLKYRFVFGQCMCVVLFFVKHFTIQVPRFSSITFDAKNHINLYTYMFPLPKSCHLRKDEKFYIMCVKMFVICQFVLIQCIFPLSNENTWILVLIWLSCSVSLFLQSSATFQMWALVFLNSPSLAGQRLASM